MCPTHGYEDVILVVEDDGSRKVGEHGVLDLLLEGALLPLLAVRPPKKAFLSPGLLYMYQHSTCCIHFKCNSDAIWI